MKKRFLSVLFYLPIFFSSAAASPDSKVEFFNKQGKVFGEAGIYPSLVENLEEVRAFLDDFEQHADEFAQGAPEGCWEGRFRQPLSKIEKKLKALEDLAKSKSGLESVYSQSKQAVDAVWDLLHTGFDNGILGKCEKKAVAFRDKFKESEAFLIPTKDLEGHAYEITNLTQQSQEEAWKESGKFIDYLERALDAVEAVKNELETGLEAYDPAAEQDAEMEAALRQAMESLPDETKKKVQSHLETYTSLLDKKNATEADLTKAKQEAARAFGEMRKAALKVGPAAVKRVDQLEGEFRKRLPQSGRAISRRGNILYDAGDPRQKWKEFKNQGGKDAPKKKTAAVGPGDDRVKIFSSVGIELCDMMRLISVPDTSVNECKRKNIKRLFQHDEAKSIERQTVLAENYLKNSAALKGKDSREAQILGLLERAKAEENPMERQRQVRDVLSLLDREKFSSTSYQKLLDARKNLQNMNMAVNTTAWNAMKAEEREAFKKRREEMNEIQKNIKEAKTQEEKDRLTEQHRQREAAYQKDWRETEAYKKAEEKYHEPFKEAREKVSTLSKEVTEEGSRIAKIMKKKQDGQPLDPSEEADLAAAQFEQARENYRKLELVGFVQGLKDSGQQMDASELGLEGLPPGALLTIRGDASNPLIGVGPYKDAKGHEIEELRYPNGNLKHMSVARPGVNRKGQAAIQIAEYSYDKDGNLKELETYVDDTANSGIFMINVVTMKGRFDSQDNLIEGEIDKGGIKTIVKFEQVSDKKTIQTYENEEGRKLREIIKEVNSQGHRLITIVDHEKGVQISHNLDTDDAVKSSLAAPFIQFKGKIVKGEFETKEKIYNRSLMDPSNPYGGMMDVNDPATGAFVGYGVDMDYLADAKNEPELLSKRVSEAARALAIKATGGPEKIGQIAFDEKMGAITQLLRDASRPRTNVERVTILYDPPEEDDPEKKGKFIIHTYPKNNEGVAQTVAQWSDVTVKDLIGEIAERWSDLSNEQMEEVLSGRNPHAQISGQAREQMEKLLEYRKKMAEDKDIRASFEIWWLKSDSRHPGHNKWFSDNNPCTGKHSPKREDIDRYEQSSGQRWTQDAEKEWCYKKWIAVKTPSYVTGAGLDIIGRVIPYKEEGGKQVLDEKRAGKFSKSHRYMGADYVDFFRADVKSDGDIRKWIPLPFLKGATTWQENNISRQKLGADGQFREIEHGKIHVNTQVLFEGPSILGEMGNVVHNVSQNAVKVFAVGSHLITAGVSLLDFGQSQFLSDFRRAQMERVKADIWGIRPIWNTEEAQKEMQTREHLGLYDKTKDIHHAREYIGGTGGAAYAGFISILDQVPALVGGAKIFGAAAHSSSNFLKMSAGIGGAYFGVEMTAHFTSTLYRFGDAAIAYLYHGDVTKKKEFDDAVEELVSQGATPFFLGHMAKSWISARKGGPGKAEAETAETKGEVKKWYEKDLGEFEGWRKWVDMPATKAAEALGVRKMFGMKSVEEMEVEKILKEEVAKIKKETEESRAPDEKINKNTGKEIVEKFEGKLKELEDYLARLEAKGSQNPPTAEELRDAYQRLTGTGKYMDHDLLLGNKNIVERYENAQARLEKLADNFKAAKNVDWELKSKYKEPGESASGIRGSDYTPIGGGKFKNVKTGDIIEFKVLKNGEVLSPDGVKLPNTEAALNHLKNIDPAKISKGDTLFIPKNEADVETKIRAKETKKDAGSSKGEEALKDIEMHLEFARQGLKDLEANQNVHPYLLRQQQLTVRALENRIALIKKAKSVTPEDPRLDPSRPEFDSDLYDFMFNPEDMPWTNPKSRIYDPRLDPKSPDYNPNVDPASKQHAPSRDPYSSQYDGLFDIPTDLVPPGISPKDWSLHPLNPYANKTLVGNSRQIAKLRETMEELNRRKDWNTEEFAEAMEKKIKELYPEENCPAEVRDLITTEASKIVNQRMDVQAKIYDSKMEKKSKSRATEEDLQKIQDDPAIERVGMVRFGGTLKQVSGDCGLQRVFNAQLKAHWMRVRKAAVEEYLERRGITRKQADYGEQFEKALYIDFFNVARAWLKDPRLGVVKGMSLEQTEVLLRGLGFENVQTMKLTSEAQLIQHLKDGLSVLGAVNTGGTGHAIIIDAAFRKPGEPWTFLIRDSNARGVKLKYGYEELGNMETRLTTSKTTDANAIRDGIEKILKESESGRKDVPSWEILEQLGKMDMQ